MTNETLLDTEELLRSLADELSKLKGAVKQYEETKNELANVRESVDKIGNASISLAENSKTFLEKLDKIGFEQRLNKLQDDASRLIEKQNEHSSRMSEQYLQQSKALDAVKNNLSEKMQQLEREQAKKLKLTQILVCVLLVLEAATLAAIFLK